MDILNCKRHFYYKHRDIEAFLTAKGVVWDPHHPLAQLLGGDDSELVWLSEDPQEYDGSYGEAWPDGAFEIIKEYEIYLTPILVEFGRGI